ncbi:hypothetical protein P261_01578 [Lachnospiraceae bacterium TWA4]|nr:hypothetical protein P261_01578 [Lachnospiraceae bacterium TWA4]
MIIFPIQRVIFAGRSEQNSTIAKNTNENPSNSILSSAIPLKIGSAPTVNEVDAQRGIAKNGPIVKYNKQVKT